MSDRRAEQAGEEAAVCGMRAGRSGIHRLGFIKVLASWESATKAP
jgi:hypothetical protein